MMIDKEKAKVWNIFDEMHEKMKNTDPEKTEELISKAVKKREDKERPTRRVNSVAQHQGLE